MRSILLALSPAVFLALLPGCSTEKPPTGTPVQLTADEKDAPAKPSRREWYAWQLKGLQLKKDGRHEEALYCFHQALGVWPKELPADEVTNDMQRMTHLPVPTDTILQLGVLYADMGNAKWALHYLDEFDRYKPGTNLTQAARQKVAALPKK